MDNFMVSVGRHDIINATAQQLYHAVRIKSSYHSSILILFPTTSSLVAFRCMRRFGVRWRISVIIIMYMYIYFINDDISFHINICHTYEIDCAEPNRMNSKKNLHRNMNFCTEIRQLFNDLTEYRMHERIAH